MRPVNLLPEDERPRRPSGTASGSGAYAVLGVLGPLLALALVYVLSANGVESRKEQLAEARQQTEVAERQAGALAPFGDFLATARTRTASVKALAGSRFDWERLVRELALVLPKGTWLTELDASVSPDTTDAPASTSGASGPSADLSGCARRQPAVAELMVRLGKMHGVSDVELQESGKEDTSGGGATGAAPSAAASSAAGDCSRGFAFKVTVSFERPAPAAGAGVGRVPARLGGGS